MIRAVRKDSRAYCGRVAAFWWMSSVFIFPVDQLQNTKKLVLALKILSD